MVLANDTAIVPDDDAEERATRERQDRGARQRERRRRDVDRHVARERRDRVGVAPRRERRAVSFKASRPEEAAEVEDEEGDDDSAATTSTTAIRARRRRACRRRVAIRSCGDQPDVGHATRMRGNASGVIDPAAQQRPARDSRAERDGGRSRSRRLSDRRARSRRLRFGVERQLGRPVVAAARIHHLDAEQRRAWARMRARVKSARGASTRRSGCGSDQRSSTIRFCTQMIACPPKRRMKSAFNRATVLRMRGADRAHADDLAVEEAPRDRPR